MLKFLSVAVLLATSVSARSSTGPTIDAKPILEAASKAMGADKLTSITYSGNANELNNFLQTPAIDGPWPMRAINNYTRSIDLTGDPAGPSSRATGSANTGGPYNQLITPANPAWAQQLEIYITPWGFLKAAAANNPTAHDQKIGKKKVDHVVTFSTQEWTSTQKAPSGASYKVTGYINSDNLVERVETWLEHPTLGDMHVEAVYTKYKDFAGVKVPTSIVRKQAEWPVLEVSVDDATPNPPNIAELLTPPASAALPPAPPSPPSPPVASEKLADGVYRITGGYVSLAVEFKDYVLVLEGGQSEARGLAVIAETKRLFPNKPIRYVFNTHPHSDHTAGLAPFVAQGAIVITQENNKQYLAAALRTPRTLLGDTLAKAQKGSKPLKPKIETVAEKRVLKDATRTVEFYHITNLTHSTGMLIALLPKEKVLFQADFTLPPAGQPANESVVTLAQNLDRLNLWNFDRYIPVHALNPDIPWTKSDLRKAVGKIN